MADLEALGVLAHQPGQQPDEFAPAVAGALGQEEEHQGCCDAVADCGEQKAQATRLAGFLYNKTQILRSLFGCVACCDVIGSGIEWRHDKGAAPA
ncbi:hypothetical protein D3C80_1811650 [compost metagenome]